MSNAGHPEIALSRSENEADFRLNLRKLLIQESTHGKHKKAGQRRTQESKTRITQESENRKAAEAAGIRSRIEKAQSEEDGARRGEAVETALGTWHLAFGPWG